MYCIGCLGRGTFQERSGYKMGVIYFRRTVLYNVLHHSQENIKHKLKYTYRKECWMDLSLKRYIKLIYSISMH
jgi:hypothetical protein